LSYDNKLDARGRPLLELCVTTKMRILNGRVIGDLFGKYTCHKPTGSSVVDYSLVLRHIALLVASLVVARNWSLARAWSNMGL
jgi:hypothetical protein